jgi:hypothetical protein
MPGVNENSSNFSRYIAVAFAFVMTCIAHAAILFVASRILEDVGATEWRLAWWDAGVLGVLAVVWRIWLRDRRR